MQNTRFKIFNQEGIFLGGIEINSGVITCSSDKLANKNYLEKRVAEIISSGLYQRKSGCKDQLIAEFVSKIDTKDKDFAEIFKEALIFEGFVVINR